MILGCLRNSEIEKVFQVGSKFYLVFPLCTGGELYDAVAARGHYCEHDTAVIVRDIVSALHALHENNILHLDIKPENILFDTRGPKGKVMLTDFGLSKLLDEPVECAPTSSSPPVTPSHLNSINTDATCSTHILTSNATSNAKSATNTALASHAYTPPVFDTYTFQYNLKRFLERGELNTEGLRGTFGYMSPEIILMHMYSKAADVFAAGVVLYILLCGYPPFSSKSLRQTLLRTAQGSYKIEGGEWDKVSAEAKDLVRRMLEIDPTKRITTAEILEHPWILAVQSTDPISPRYGPITLITCMTFILMGCGPSCSVPAEGSTDFPVPPPPPKATIALSQENLTGALSRLADHGNSPLLAAVTEFQVYSLRLSLYSQNSQDQQDGGHDHQVSLHKHSSQFAFAPLEQVPGASPPRRRGGPQRRHNQGDHVVRISVGGGNSLHGVE